MELTAQYFRAGIGAVIANTDGLVLALERTDVPGAWQLPQGGLEVEEEPFEAAIREITEETGIMENDIELIDSYPGLLAYELPKEIRNKKIGRGQVHHWFLFKFLGDENTIDEKSGDEFRSWQWMSLDDLAGSAADFRRSVYKALAERFNPKLKSL